MANNLLNELEKKQTTLSVIGMGYVGLPLAHAFSNHFNVTGYDIDIEKIDNYKMGIDVTNELGDEILKKSAINFTTNIDDLIDSKLFIVTVPTPINQDKTPDLSPLINATRLIGSIMSKDSYIVYESTVYPGATEEICIPILESESNLKNGIDFHVGYSPERINPADKVNSLDKIVKIVSAQDLKSLETISSIYSKIILAGIHPVSSIKVAEAAKVIENSQRDINIAFMNEIAMVFNSMGVDTSEVIKAMNTKWNALKFNPGLVGGHCIGVDPYYFAYESQKLGHHSNLIVSSRNINNSIPEFIVNQTIKLMICNGIDVSKSKIAILGVTFKENCPDFRNSKVIDMIDSFSSFGIKTTLIDPHVDKILFNKLHNHKVIEINNLRNQDVIVLAVTHQEFKQLGLKELNKYFNPKTTKILIDVKSMYSLEELRQSSFVYWRL